MTLSTSILRANEIQTLPDRITNLTLIDSNEISDVSLFLHLEKAMEKTGSLEFAGATCVTDPIRILVLYSLGFVWFSMWPLFP